MAASIRRLLCLLAHAGCASLAQAAAVTTVSVGVDHAYGHYGSVDATHSTSVPIAVKHETGRWILRASLPFLRVDGVTNRDIAGADGSIVGSAVVPETQAGVGDLTLVATYALIANPVTAGIDFGVKAKIATAKKENTLLSTGEADYSAQLDTFKVFGKLAAFATVGYTIKGAPAGVEFDNPWYGTLGANLAFGQGHNIGAAFDYRQKLTAHGFPIAEWSLFAGTRFSPRDQLQVYYVVGVADGSPEHAGGIVISRRY